jgi:hypothetical protein
MLYIMELSRFDPGAPGFRFTPHAHRDVSLSAWFTPVWLGASLTGLWRAQSKASYSTSHPLISEGKACIF